jgi:hypothetical protein
VARADRRRDTAGPKAAAPIIRMNVLLDEGIDFFPAYPSALELALVHSIRALKRLGYNLCKG